MVGSPHVSITPCGDLLFQGKASDRRQSNSKERSGEPLLGSSWPGAARRLLDQSTFLDLAGIGGRFAYAWGTLPTYVRTGRPGYHQLFGMSFW